MIGREFERGFGGGLAWLINNNIKKKKGRTGSEISLKSLLCCLFS